MHTILASQCWSFYSKSYNIVPF